MPRLTFPGGLRRLWRSKEDIARDVDEEIAFHLDARAGELVRLGVGPTAAREQAEREFGDLMMARRALRVQDARLERRRQRRAWLDDFRRDVLLGVRSLRKQLAFTVIAIAILALGIGASVGMFTVLNAVLLRPLPYPEADRLVHLSPGQASNVTIARAIADGTPSVIASTGLSVWGLTLTGAGEAVSIGTQAVDAEFFHVFRAQPVLGRPFLQEEHDPSRSDVVVLSHRLWQTRFGSREDVIGQRLELDGYGHTARKVVGVMPAGFGAPLSSEGEEIDLWIPFKLTPGATVASDKSYYVNHLVGRLAPGATVEQAAQEVRAVMTSLRGEFGNLIDPDAVRTAGAAGLLDSIVGDVRRTFWVLMVAVSLVFLLACANLANLLLAQGEGERRGLTVRAALGAGRARLVRQQLTRGLILAGIGGACGLVVARGVLALLLIGRGAGLPRTGELGLDWRVLLFALIASLLSVALSGLLPALRATAMDLRDALAAGGQRAGGARSSHRLNRALVAGEMALAVVLVSGAGLMLSSFRALRSVDPGMDASDVLAIHVSPRENEYESREQVVAFYQQVLERLSALAGVRQAGAIHLLPFTDNNWNYPYLAEGQSPPTDGPLPSANFRVVTPGYVETVDVPLLAGRNIADTDRSDSPTVGLINESFAQRLWPGEDPIGREIQIFGDTPFRVVGVVGDVRQHALDREPTVEMYIPLAQWPLTSMVVMIEGSAAPDLTAAAREAVWSVNEHVPIIDVRPLADAMVDSVARQRFFTSLLTFFGLLALTLGAIGVYGVTAYTVRARLPELGMRLALGATPAAVRRHALARALTPVAIGLGAGLAVALVASRTLSHVLYGIEATDAATFAAVLIVLACVAVVATYLPAYRASQVNPAGVLDAE